MYENCVTNQQMLNMHFSTKHKKQCDIVLQKKPTKKHPSISGRARDNVCKQWV